MAVPKVRLEQIPEPTEDPAALLLTVKSLKTAVEQLTGARGDAATVRNFVQQAAPIGMVLGDLWTKPADLQVQVGAGISQSDGTVVSFWNSNAWVVIASSGQFIEKVLLTAVGVPSDDSQNDLLSTGEIGAAGQVWEIGARAAVYNNTGAASAFSRLLHDGVTSISEGIVTVPNANYSGMMFLHRVILLTRPSIFKLQGKSQAGNPGTCFFVNDNTSLWAIRLL